MLCVLLLRCDIFRIVLRVQRKQQIDRMPRASAVAKLSAVSVDQDAWAAKTLLQLAKKETSVRSLLKHHYKAASGRQAEQGKAKEERVSDFQVSVWASCLVPKGQVCTYGAMAMILCAKKHLAEYTDKNGNTTIASAKLAIEATKNGGYGSLARGVGGALRMNPIAPVVPCHRVVSSSGALHGFCGSTGDEQLGKKASLLKAEGVTFTPNGQTVNRSCLLCP